MGTKLKNCIVLLKSSKVIAIKIGIKDLLLPQKCTLSAKNF